MKLFLRTKLFFKLAQDITQQEDSRWDPAISSSTITDNMIIQTAKKFNIDIKQLNYASRGHWSQVFNYKNRVIKFTLSHADVNAILRLEALRGKVKNDKHLLRVFNVEHDPDTGLFMIEVERLRPLNGHVKMLLFGPPNSSEARQLRQETPRFLFEVFKNSSLMVQLILDKAMNALKLENKETFEALQPHRRRIYSLLLAYFAQAAQKAPKTSKDVMDLDKLLMDIVQGAKSILADRMYELEYNDIGAFTRELWEPISMVARHRFPKTRNQLRPELETQYREFAETRSLMEFFNDLKNAGVYWDDVRDVNLMQRQNGDIVVSDPGLFKFD